MKLKVIGSVAVVGTLAVMALLNLSINESEGSTFLASKIDDEIVKAFNQHISKHDRNFLTKEEYRARLAHFKNTYDVVMAHNAKNDTNYKLALNFMSDWSPAERAAYGGLRAPVDTEDDSTEVKGLGSSSAEPTLLTAPASIDWRQYGAVTSVKN